MELKDLEAYKLSKELSGVCWNMYETFDWQIKKIIGDQFITAIDSVAANIAEGFGRFHYLDRNKFNYNARGSLIEGLHWLDTLHERGKITSIAYADALQKIKVLSVKLNNYITATKDRNKNK